MMNFISFLISLLGVLISVAFMILLERKVLGYIQVRKGPNKVGLIGVIQSFSDAIKLFVKEQNLPSSSNKFLFFLSPFFSLLVILLAWLSFPKKDEMISWLLSSLFFFCCTSLGVYTLIGSGWSSNSNYSLIGSIRGVAQTVSYEVSLLLIFICFLVSSFQFSFMKLFYVQLLFVNLSVFVPLMLLWVISSLSETNRTPFDFSEGESELVSGFNVEYGSGGFALLFLAEYASIILMSYFICLLFFSSCSFYLVYLISIFWIFFFIWVRSCYPRFRYDKLMDLSWKIFLPFVLLLMFYYVSLLS